MHVSSILNKSCNIIGASLSEPHINGTSMRELYIYIYIYILWYVGHVGIIASYGHKNAK